MNKNQKLLPNYRFPEFENNEEWNQKRLEQIVDSKNSSIALNKLNKKEDGFPVYGADGIITYINEYEQSMPYISIVKDGSGYGRLRFCEAKSSILGTLAYIFTKDPKKYDLIWLYYLLNTINFDKYKKGAAIPHIYFSDYKNEIIGLPKPKEQQKIASCLSSLDELINLHKEKLDALKEHKKGLLQNLFPQEGKKVPRYRFPEFENDGEWEFDKFSKFIKLFRGSSPRPIKKYRTNNDDGINWIRIGDAPKEGCFLLDNVDEKITVEGARKSRSVHVGEIILANSMTYGNAYKLGIEGCIYDGWFVLREYEDTFDKSFLLQLLNSSLVHSQYQKLAAGGIVKNISSKIVYSVRLPKPRNIEEQQKIANCLSSIDELITAQEDKIYQLKQHKKGLLQGLFPKIEN